jgi:hypothetical protein
VLKSTTTAPRSTPSATPPGPKSTASTSGVSGRQRHTQAAPRAASAGSEAQAAPASSNGAAFARLRLCAESAKPARPMFAAIAAPMTPSPMKETRAGGRIGSGEAMCRQLLRKAARTSSSSVSMARWKPGPSV